MAVWPYSTARWQRLRAAKLARNPLCEYCPPDTLTPATAVDHKHAINRGGAPFDMRNLASVCVPCHSRKTWAEDRPDQRDAPAAIGPDGWPVDPQHPAIIADRRDGEGGSNL